MLKRIPLELITRNPDQLRQTFNKAALEELAASIFENGLQQPITVRPIERDADGHEFMVIMGERRFRAHKLLLEDGHCTHILAQVRKMGDREMHINAILENLQRSEVSPLEEADAYQRAIEVFGFTVPELAKKLGISQSWRITYRLKLLGLTPDNRNLVTRGVISMTQAYHMAGLSVNGQTSFLALCKSGLASTEASAAAVAAAIEAKEAQIEMPIVAEQPRKQSISSIDTQVDRIGASVQPFFKDGQFKIKGPLDPGQAQRCAEKIKLLRAHLGHVERELMRAASVSAVAA